MRKEDKQNELIRRLGYSFTNLALLRSAITHRSTGGMHNERLEFLGDSLLNFTIASELYHRFPKAREGELTRMRARLVRGETLAEIARDLSIGDYLELGAGEKKSGGQKRDSILADALEAIIGALYLDGGVEICRERILTWYESRLDHLTVDKTEKDAKTRLQEYLQAKRLPLPEYKVMRIEGDPHSPTFKIECKVSLLDKPTIGMAQSRRKAEQIAAENALLTLQTLTERKK